ncbi:amidohydrolase family protein [Paracoccus sp. CPCC 101403]|uniref:Amidohydrolase family protein n=1 Tax=Paracoccus broussonetiae TaxID=3075834 RepID=A0ABU3E9K9_9RHOB|nr:amidohydrolase family protein [Paracoccus sp. CPCC 101403]MDT1060903.1 amidohydrolase family protein [Paracoccus sp. CPCC 101403]
MVRPERTLLAAGALLVTLISTPAIAAETAPETLFTDVRVYDGKGDSLSAPTSVLVRGNLVAEIGDDATAGADAAVIDGGGRTLMPGLIDAHWHTMLIRQTPEQMLFGDIGLINLLAGAEATATLMRGFTTVRDLGGPSFGLKQAIDSGVVPGPRIWPSGAIISVTSGHGDFRPLSDLPRDSSKPLSRVEDLGGAMIADSPDEVRQRAREQLMLGASQIKLTAGGGVASPHSPIDVSTFTPEELGAAVEAASNWGTYVTVHAYTSAAVRRAIDAGVKVIEHGQLIDEDTAKYMAEKGIWLSAQPITHEFFGGMFPPGSDQDQKAAEVMEGTDRLYKLAKKYNLKLAFGTDVLFSEAMARQQGRMLVSLKQWFTPAEILRQATSTNAELLQLSGLRSPYKGKLGVVEEGAFADLLLVDGDPLANIDLLADAERNLLIIMKDGRIYKNTLSE